MAAPVSEISHLGSFQLVALPFLGCCPLLHGPRWLLQLLPSQLHSNQWKAEKRKWRVRFFLVRTGSRSCMHFHSCGIGQNLVMWSPVGARESGKCSLLLSTAILTYLGEQGSACESFRAEWS